MSREPGPGIRKRLALAILFFGTIFGVYVAFVAIDLRANPRRGCGHLRPSLAEAVPILFRATHCCDSYRVVRFLIVLGQAQEQFQRAHDRFASPLEELIDGDLLDEDRREHGMPSFASFGRRMTATTDAWEFSVWEEEVYALPGRYRVTSSGELFLLPREGGSKVLLQKF